jgi:ASPM-SPD-2-Hydin domain-containing protein
MHGRLFLGLVISIAAIAVGCGGGSAASRGAKAGKTGTSTSTGGTSSSSGSSSSGSSSSSGGSAKPVAAGQLAVSPAVLNFGQVTVGTAKTQAATLTAGNASITVRSADWRGSGYSITGITFPATIPAGQSAHFKVTFAPQAAGSAKGNIKFSSTADNTPQASFNGNGTQTAAHSVSLSWRPPHASVVGYNIYRGSDPKGPFTKITGSPHPNSSFTDGSVVGGASYFYVTTAVNKKGKESKPSNQVHVTIPNS